MTCLARSSLSMLPEEKKGDSGPKRRRIGFQYGNPNSVLVSISTSIAIGKITERGREIGGREC
jgi:hypothetical protein